MAVGDAAPSNTIEHEHRVAYRRRSRDDTRVTEECPCGER